MLLRQKRSDFLLFRALVHPIGAMRTENTWPFSSQKDFGPQKIEKRLDFLFFPRVFSGLQGGHHKIPARPTFVLVRVTELNYVVLEAVYQIIRAPGWILRV